MSFVSIIQSCSPISTRSISASHANSRALSIGNSQICSQAAQITLTLEALISSLILLSFDINYAFIDKLFANLANLDFFLLQLFGWIIFFFTNLSIAEYTLERRSEITLLSQALIAFSRVLTASL